MARNETRRSEEGAAAVEFALLAGVLVMIIVGIAQFGLSFSQYTQAVHAAREGARWASIRPPDGVGTVDEPDSVRGRASAAAPNLPLEDGDIEVSIGGTMLDAGDLILEADTGQPVEVVVRFDSPVIVPLMDAFFDDGMIRLTSTARLMVE